LAWNSDDNSQTLEVIGINNIPILVGEELYYRIKASSAITKGQVVMFTGTLGASGGLTGAPATGLTAATGSYILGIATESIALNGWGYVTSFGEVRGFDTTGSASSETWANGDVLYYNPAVTGGLTKTIPVAPNAKVQVAAVVYADANGSVFVRPVGCLRFDPDQRRCHCLE
jgi:L-alanine-DL-glutamate epimerase-like enolase superfamily enzyme